MLSAENGMTVGRVEYAPGYNGSPGKVGIDPISMFVHLAGHSPIDRSAEIGTIPDVPHPSGDSPLVNARAWEQWHRPPLTVPANDNAKLPKVVAISGLAGSGKSTLADYLIQRHGYIRVKFAGPLKDMCRAVGLTDHHIEGALKEVPCPLLQGKTPRFFMQQLGTQFGRDIIGPEFWTGLWAATANDVLDHGGRVVTDDCRFDNEADTVRQFGGVVIQLKGRGGIAGAHASEAGIDADVVLRNDGAVGELCRRADEVLFGRW